MKKAVIILLSVFFTCAIAEDCMAQYRKTKWLDGTWTGTGFQPDATNDTWQIILTHDASKKFSQIDYPDFPCSGYWELIDANRHKAEFNEKLTEGKDRCQDSGKIIITKINDNFVTISYFYPEFTKKVVAFSTLEKE